MLSKEQIDELRLWVFKEEGDLTSDAMRKLLDQAEAAIELRNAGTTLARLCEKERRYETDAEFHDLVDKVMALAILPTGDYTPHRDYGGKPCPDFPFR